MVEVPEIIKQLREDEKDGILYASISQILEETQGIEETYDESFASTEFQSKDILSEESPLEDQGLYQMDTLYRSIVELSPDGIIVLDLKGVVLSCNAAAVKLLGYSKEELIGVKFSKIGELDKKEITKYLKLFVSIIRGKIVDPFELELTRKDGTSFTAEIRVSLLKDGGKKIGLQVIVRDISEQKKAEKQLKKSEKKYRLIIENMQDVFYRADKNGKLIMISPSALDLFGFDSLDDVIGLDVANDFYFNPDDRKLFLKALHDNNGRLLNYEIDLKRTDGSKVSVITSSTFFTDEEGNIAGIEGIFSDITERRRSEEKMKLLVDMLDVAPCSIMVYDFDGNILYANEKTFEMHGYDKHEFLTLKLYEIDVPESAELIQERMERIRVKGEDTFEVTHHRKDGSTFPMSAYVKIVDWNGKPALLSLGSDISERKEYEAQLKSSQKRLDTLLSNTPAVIYSYEASKDGMKITYINENLKHIIGFEPDDFIENEQFQQQCIHPEDRKIVFEEISEMIAGEKDESYVTYRFKDKNGDYRWLSDSHKVLSRKNGQVEVVGAWWDATDQKQAQQKLANSEKNFRTFFETMDDLIFIGNKKGEIFYANSAVTKKLGYSKEELNGMHVLDVHPDLKRPEAKQIFADMFSGKRDSCPLPLARKDGSFVPVETRVWFGEWDGKECIFGISKDLTKQQAALDKFHKLFDNNPALMAVSSMPDRHFVDVNNAFLEKLGYDREEIIGTTSAELNIFVEPEKQRLISKELSTTGHVRDIELKVKAKDGRLLTGLFSGEIIDNQGDKSFLTVMTDRTKQKEAEKKLKEKLDELERWKKVTVNRELRIRELKKKLEKLENEVK